MHNAFYPVASAQFKCRIVTKTSWVNWRFTSAHIQRYFSHLFDGRCTDGLKKKLYLRSGSQRHRHFAGFFNVPVLHRHGTTLFIRWFQHTAPTKTKPGKMHYVICIASIGEQVTTQRNLANLGSWDTIRFSSSKSINWLNVRLYWSIEADWTLLVLLVLGWLLVCCLYKEVYLQIFKLVYFWGWARKPS